MTIPFDSKTLMQLLAKKCELLVQLRQLGAQQCKLIDTGEMSQLLHLLAVKQRLIAALQNIERQLDPYRTQSPQERQWEGEDDRRRCAELAVAGERLLAEVLGLEQHSENHLLIRRDETATQLQEVHSSAETQKAYVEPLLPANGQVDLSTE